MAVSVPGSGVDRETGRVLSGWPHCEQSLFVLFTTGYGERIMREWVGSLVPAMLGENLTVVTVDRTKVAMFAAIEAEEPRFRITKIRSLSVNRSGQYRLELEGVYRPRAHLGDFTVEGSRKITVGPPTERRDA